MFYDKLSETPDGDTRESESQGETSSFDISKVTIAIGDFDIKFHEEYKGQILDIVIHKSGNIVNIIRVSKDANLIANIEKQSKDGFGDLSAQSAIKDIINREALKSLKTIWCAVNGKLVDGITESEIFILKNNDGSMSYVCKHFNDQYKVCVFLDKSKFKAIPDVKSSEFAKVLNKTIENHEELMDLLNEDNKNMWTKLKEFTSKVTINEFGKYFELTNAYSAINIIFNKESGKTINDLVSELFNNKYTELMNFMKHNGNTDIDIPDFGYLEGKINNYPKRGLLNDVANFDMASFKKNVKRIMGVFNALRDSLNSDACANLNNLCKLFKNYDDSKNLIVYDNAVIEVHIFDFDGIKKLDIYLRLSSIDINEFHKDIEFLYNIRESDADKIVKLKNITEGNTNIRLYCGVYNGAFDDVNIGNELKNAYSDKSKIDVLMMKFVSSHLIYCTFPDFNSIKSRLSLTLKKLICIASYLNYKVDKFIHILQSILSEMVFEEIMDDGLDVVKCINSVDIYNKMTNFLNEPDLR